MSPELSPVTCVLYLLLTASKQTSPYPEVRKNRARYSANPIVREQIHSGRSGDSRPGQGGEVTLRKGWRVP